MLSADFFFFFFFCVNKRTVSYTKRRTPSIFSPYNALMYYCRYLVLSFEEAHLRHIHCKENSCADLLVTAGNNILGLFLQMIYPSSFVVSQLLADI
jgi:hypothetical protein